MKALLPLLALVVLAGCRERIPRLKDACVAQRDCAMTMQGDDCCFGCAAGAGTATSLLERTAWCEKRFPGGSPATCPRPKCLPENLTPFCLEDHCVLRGL